MGNFKGVRNNLLLYLFCDTDISMKQKKMIFWDDASISPEVYNIYKDFT